MDRPNVRSSKTSKKKVEPTIDIRVVGGELNILEKGNEYYMEMNPEYLLDFSEPLMDLAKSVGTYTGYIDENGKIVERVDNKTGIKFNLNSESINKAMKKKQKDLTNVTIVAIDGKKIENAKEELDRNKVSNLDRNI